MELGLIVLMVNGEQHLFIRRIWLTKTFVAGDVVAFMMQAAGGGLQASKNAAIVRVSKTILLVCTTGLINAYDSVDTADF